MNDDISKIVKSLQKDYRSLRVAGDEEDPKDYISTGNKSLDLVLNGGIAFGYVTELIGLSGSGKTTIMQLLLANAQKKYKAIGIWLDREKAWSNDRAIQLGIDIDRVIVINPEDIPSMIEATQLLEKVLKKLDPDMYKFIAIDSVSAFDDPLTIDKADMGKKAQQVHRFFRKTIRYMSDITSINIANHITYKSGVVFGDPKTVTSGEATKYYSNYRIELNDLRKIYDTDRGSDPVGSWIKATVIKTRRGPNFRSVVFPHYYEKDFPYYGGYARLLADRNYIKPKNVQEFNKFAQTTVLYKDSRFNEFDIEEKLKDFPELEFDKYPEYSTEDFVKQEETEEE